MATETLKIAELVASMPEVDEPEKGGKSKAPKDGGAKFTGPAPEEAAKVYAAILASGKGGLRELIQLVQAPEDPDYRDYKAEYVLHGLVVYAGVPGREKDGQLVADALAAEIGNGKLPKGTRGILIRELRWIGTVKHTSALASLLEDPDLCQHAVAALQSIREGAARSLAAALPRVKGRNRAAVLQALAEIGAVETVKTVRGYLRDADADVRRAAAWTLAALTDGDSAIALLQAVDAAEGWERSQLVKYCLVLAENLAVAGKKAEALKIYQHLRDHSQEKIEFKGIS